MKSTLHYIIPTNNPNEFYSKIIRRIDIFESVADIATFGINFQPPWTEEQIADVVRIFKQRNLILFYTYNEYKCKKEETPFLKIRDDAAILNPDASFFVSVDDDIEYLCTKEKYRKVINDSLGYMNWRNIGSLSIGHPSSIGFDKDPKNDGRIHKTKNALSTCLGMIVRNIYDGHLVPDEYINCIGGCEDHLISEVRRLYSGLESAYNGVFIGHHTDIKNPEDRSGFRLNLSKSKHNSNSCKSAIKKLKQEYEAE